MKLTAVTSGPSHPANFARAVGYQHPATEEVTAGMGRGWLVTSVDDREIVAGNLSAGAHSRAAWTTQPGLVVPVTELVPHDLYELALLREHGDLLEKSFGPGLATLREEHGPLQ